MLLEKLEQLAIGSITVLLTLIVTFLVYRLASSGVSKLGREGHLTPVMAHRLRRLIRGLVVLVAVLVLVEQLGILQNAWAVLSAVLAAVAVGFVALWSVFSNIVCALMILVYRPFRIGDDVEVLESSGGGPRGRAVDMNLMFTTLAEENSETSDGALLRIPNSQFFLKSIRCRPEAAAKERTTFLDPERASRAMQADSVFRERASDV